MFGKHFASMYTGSLFGKPATVFAVWGYCISNMRPRKDGGCFVELNPILLAPMFAAKHEEIRAAIDFLLSDDPLSRTEDNDGRRLELEHGKLDGPATYLVVNGAKYRAARDEETRREQVREAVARHREKKGGNQSKPSKPRKAHAEIRDQRQRSEADAESESAGAREQPQQSDEPAEHDPGELIDAGGVAKLWHAAIEQPGGATGIAHYPAVWRETYELIASHCNGFEQPAQVCRDVCEYFWLAPSGPIQGARISRNLATPKDLLGRIGGDIESAAAWKARSQNATSLGQSMTNGGAQ